MIGNVNEGEVDLVELIIVEVHHYKIKKQNSNMYYITFTGHTSILGDGFYKVIIEMGYPLKKSSSVFANTEPKATYGPNNSPKIYTKPR